ncbi:MAG TPA: LysE family transporter [Burkholderiales bacterium]|nr:LysE family transporter [Burkholderiales bacterium]
MALFLKALAFGFVLAAAVGPMWVLCFRRSVAAGALAGFVSGLGIALADGVYAAVAAFGLSAVSGFLLGQHSWLALLGGAFLVWLGAKALLAAPAPLDAPERAVPSARGLGTAFLSTFGLTLVNPPTILAFVAIFTALGLAASADYAAAALAVLGVFVGSACWWLILALGAGWLRARLGARLTRAVNTLSGLLMLGFAAWQIAPLL